MVDKAHLHLDSLLPRASNFARLAERVQGLAETCEALSAAAAARQEEEALRGGPFLTADAVDKRVEAAVQALRQKVVEMNRARLDEMSALSLAMDERSTMYNERHRHLGDELESLRSVVRGLSDDRATVASVDELRTHHDALRTDVALKAAGAQVLELTEDLSRLRELVGRKEDGQAADVSRDRLVALEAAATQAASREALETLRLDVLCLRDANERKAEAERVGEAEARVERLEMDIEDKALRSVVDLLAERLRAAEAALPSKAGAAAVAAVEEQLRGLSGKVDIWWTRALAYQKLPDCEG